MAILKLNIGRQHAVSGTVQTVELDTTGKFGAQYKVTFITGDTMWIAKDAADRQMARLSLLPNEMEGETLTFWKKPTAEDPNKSYLNIERGASGVSVADVARNDDVQARDLRSVGVQVKRAQSFDEVVDKYAECLGKAHALVTDYNDSLAADGRQLPPEVTTAVAATLLIERSKAGV